MHSTALRALGASCLAVALPSLAAQQVTSPAGYDTTEGETTFNHFTLPSSSSLGRRFQQVDATHAASGGLLIQSMGFRRDGGSSGGGTNEPPRTMDLEITMGYADMSVLTRRFDDNFLAGSRQVVFTKKQVSMPDWTGNAGTPAPFDFNVALDTPFPYAGPFALVIDFVHENVAYTTGTAPSGTSVDRGYIGALTSNASDLGTGCTPTNLPGAFDHNMRMENNGAGGGAHGMRMRVSGTNAPFGAPLVMNIDLQDLNLTVPGLCTTIHAGGLVTVPFGTSSATGGITETSISFGHSPAFVGASLVTQFAAIDAGLPFGVALSNGQQGTMPGDPSSTSNDCVYHWAGLPSDEGTLFFGGGMVLKLGL